MPKDDNDMSQHRPNIPYKSRDALEKERKGEDGENSVEALMERINGFQTQLGEVLAENKRLSATNQALLSNPAGQYTQEEEPKPPAGVDLKGLPDAYSHPEEHATELNKRINAAINANVDYATQKQARAAKAANDQASRADNLWDSFQQTYPDLAKQRSVVRVAAVEVAEDAKKRGVDLDSYMYKTTDLFMADVAAKIKADFGRLYEPADDADPEPAPEPNRTGGLHGGGQQQRTKPTRDPDDEPGDFAAELQDTQRNMGIF